MKDLNVRLHRQLWVFSSRLTRLDGEPHLRTGEKNGARKSLIHLAGFVVGFDRDTLPQTSEPARKLWKIPV